MQDLIESIRDATKAMEDFCLALQRNSPEFIERNRRLMRAGKIEFDEYEDVK